jgi:hypothetical protein
MLGAKADIKVVQETLGHSAYEVTADAYTSVLDELARAATEGAARLVPRIPPTTPAHTSRTREIDMTS